MVLSKLDSLKDVFDLIESNQKVLGTEKVLLKDAYKRVLAEEIISFHDYPPFDKSTKDGFAIKYQNTTGASKSNPKTFKIIDAIGAGDYSSKTVGENEAIIIATGAPIPSGADAVVMKEFTQTNEDKVEVYSQVSFFENIVPKAKDFKAGSKLIEKNTLITFKEISLIASCGFSEVEVFKKPKVKLIVTGNELLEPTKTLDKSKIINSNQFTISYLIKDCGADFNISHVRDDFDTLSHEIEVASREYDVVMTTGGTAISKGDLVLNVVGSIGEVLFHGVPIKPGKLMGVGIVNDTMVFNFSGQPIAAITQFDIFARKYLFQMQGRSFDFNIVKRKSNFKLSSKKGMCNFIRSFCDDEVVIDIQNKGSTIIDSIISNNSYIILDESNEGCEENDLVEVIFFNSMVW